MRNVQLFVLLSGLFFVVFLMSCSKSGHAPIVPGVSSEDIPVFSSEEKNNRDVFAVYDAVIDPETKTFVIEPMERVADFHVPLRYYFPDCLQITNYTWTSYGLNASIKLSHPLPQSKIDVFDARVIAIVPANTGVSMYYPIFNVLANNQAVMNPDGYTPLWDSLGGSIPGTNNPFKAYFKYESNRRWSFSQPEETLTWKINLSGFGGPMVFKLVVDISTNFPEWSNPGIDNAPEPVDMWATVGEGLTESGGSALLDVEFLDWQGWEDIKTKVECPDLFDGAVQLFYSRPGGKENRYIFSETIQNAHLKPEGEYPLLIAAWDLPTQIHIYKEVTVKVQDDDVFNPVDVTPEWLNFCPLDVYVEGDYAFVAANLYGVHIFNVANPSNPTWIKKVPLSGRIGKVFVSNGYAYATIWSGDEVLHILDVSPPESTYLVNSVSVSLRGARDIHVVGEYAYVAVSYDGLNIIDISPPESAFVVKKVNVGNAEAVSVVNGYAYVADFNAGLKIVDVDPPESAFVVKQLDMGYSDCIYVDGEYAYVGVRDVGLVVADINPPESATILQTVSGMDDAYDVFVSNGYAYVAEGNVGLHVIDVEPLNSAQIVKTVEAGDGSGVFVKNSLAYFTSYNSGLYVVDINPPESANIIGSVETPGYAWGVFASVDGYAYVADMRGGVQIIDIDPPESANVIRTIDTPGAVYEVCVHEGYAYAADYEEGLCIIDIDPPETAHIVQSIATGGNTFHVQVYGKAGTEYAYFTSYGSGLHIVNIDPPESAYIINTVNPPMYADGFDVAGEYAYVVENDVGLHIIDIDPPGSAQIVKTVPLEVDWSQGVGYANGYAYVINYNGGCVYQIDVDPIDQAEVVKVIEEISSGWDFHVSDGYLYVGNDRAGLYIVDIVPPELIFIEEKIDTLLYARGCSTSGDYAYVGDYLGLQIIKLR